MCGGGHQLDGMGWGWLWTKLGLRNTFPRLPLFCYCFASVAWVLRDPVYTMLATTSYKYTGSRRQHSSIHSWLNQQNNNNKIDCDIKMKIKKQTIQP